MQILPGGGIKAEHAAQLLTRTGCRQLHIGASTALCDESLNLRQEIDFCNFDYLRQGKHRAVAAERVAAVVSAIA